jgi:hypothetical protein
MRAVEEIAMATVTVLLALLLISHTAFANFYVRTDNHEIFRYPCDRLILEEHSQNSAGKYWENVKGSNFPLTLMDWKLASKPGSRDKYMNKRLVGTVKNNSKEEFSEVKVEFTVYDEEGAPIGTVFSNLYNFKPGDIWKFEIPATSDVGKAELKGLYVPLKE